MLPTVWSEDALADANDLLGYIAERNAPAALRMRHLIIDTAARLGERPYLYRPGRVSGTREAVVHPNYIVVYRVELDMIRIVNVLHARQQYP